MNAENFLHVPLESLALSSSSSASSFSSLFSSGLQSDSQTDISPPQSPPLEKEPVSSLEKPAISRLVSFLDFGATPRLPSPKLELPTLLDNGYDSEHEGGLRTQIKSRTRLLTRKRRDSFRTQGLNLIGLMTPHANEEIQPHLTCLLSHEKPSKICAGTNQEKTRPTTTHHTTTSLPATSPLKPRILPVFAADSPSPIFPLPSPVAKHSRFLVFKLPDKPRILPCLLSEDMSPMVLPPRTDILCQRSDQNPSAQADFYPFLLDRVVPGLSCSQNALSAPSASLVCSLADPSVDLGLASSTGISPHDPALVSDIDFAAVPMFHPVPTTTKMTTGIGLGLPISLGHRTHLERTSRVKLGTTTRTVSPPSPSSNRQFGGMMTGVKRLFKTYHYPRRRLYDIPELVSPTYASSRAKTFSAQGAVSCWSGSNPPKRYGSRKPSMRIPSRFRPRPTSAQEGFKPCAAGTSPGVRVHMDVPHNLKIAERSHAAKRDLTANLLF